MKETQEELDRARKVGRELRFYKEKKDILTQAQEIKQKGWITLNNLWIEVDMAVIKDFVY